MVDDMRKGNQVTVLGKAVINIYYLVSLYLIQVYKNVMVAALSSGVKSEEPLGH